MALTAWISVQSVGQGPQRRTQAQGRGGQGILEREHRPHVFR